MLTTQPNPIFSPETLSPCASDPFPVFRACLAENTVTEIPAGTPVPMGAPAPPPPARPTEDDRPRGGGSPEAVEAQAAAVVGGQRLGEALRGGVGMLGR